MAQRRNQDDDWARQVPREHAEDLPYDDFGWEPHQSGLPEFRDPSDRFMPRERRRVERWRPLERTEAGDYRVRMEGNSQQPRRTGPYAGIGPRGYRRSDERIRDDICERMTQHGMLDASNMEVQVHQGEVTLTGTARNRQEKRLAEDLAESVSGVSDIHNQLRLSGVPGGGAGRREDVRGSGVYPASGPMPEGDAEVHDMASWGQGDRGAEGYYDHGESEIRVGRQEEQNKGENR